MILDLQHEQCATRIHRRICVVGTGIGGGSFVSRYPEGRGDLVIIEAGSEMENPAVECECVGHPFGLPITREISVGGTSNAWRSLSSPLDAVDFARAAGADPGGWPFDLAVLKPYYMEACKLLGLPDFDHFTPASSRPDIVELASVMPFDRDLLVQKSFVYARPPKNFRHDILQRCAGEGDLLLMNAVAVELVTDSTGGRIERLRIKDPTGKTIEIQADCFVIAAGALETPRLLLNSRARHTSGVGNDHDMVGRCLMDHPMGSLSQVRLPRLINAPLYQSFPLRPGQFIKAGLVLHERVQQQEGMLNHCLYLWPSFRRGIDERFEALRRRLISARSRRLNPGDLWTLLSNPNTGYRVLSFILPIGALYRYADLFFVTEQRPNKDSRVTLSEQKDRFGYSIARVDWVLSEPDVDSIAAFNTRALTALSARGATVTFRATDDQIRDRLTSAAHHMGTARMSADPHDGVVDRDLKVWGTENLFVSDTSVFPTSGNANPGLTVCALAIRLAERLSKWS
jgi:choline dehydrogenase-like flavoprotein